MRYALHGSGDCNPGETYFAEQDVCCPVGQLPYAGSFGWTCMTPELKETRASCAADGMGFDPASGACVVYGPGGVVSPVARTATMANAAKTIGLGAVIVGALVGGGILWWMRGRGR